MSETINEMNKLRIDSPLTISNVNMTTLLFSDNLVSPKDTYTIVDNMLILKTQPQVNLELFEFVDSSRYYEFLMNLTSKGVVISGSDRYGNELSNLSNTVLVFINGYKLASDEYIINTVNNSITIKSNFTEKQLSNIVIYTSADMVYEGNVENDFSWDPDYNQFTLKDYTIERYIFFKNGELLPPNKIQKISDKVRLNTTIKHGVDFVEYYRMTRDCCALTFEPEFGYLTYGPKDTRDNLIQNPYDCMITFDNITRLLIDDVRPGFFVHEEAGDGCIMIIDDNFEGCSLKCLKIRDFGKKMLSSSEYFLTVPDAPSITKYVSQYDLNGVLFKELLASFQKVLLNETYDSIQRLKNIRNINKVDSSNICALINFLGLKINVTNLTLAKKHHLVEELRTFYDTVGTRASYNFYNAIKNEGKILNIEQLFTPIKSNVSDKKAESFFPAKWGTLQYVRQTVTNDETNKSYVYIWSFRFANGYTLPVVIRGTTNNPEWNFAYIEKTQKAIYNSATYDEKKRTWVNSVAQDKEKQMVWLRDGDQLDSKSMLLAKKQNWDEGHLVGGQPSVNTERYNFIIGEDTLTIIDTYLTLTIGTWKLYKENITPQVQDPIRRYVTFRTAEELGASYKQRYETEITDFGAVSELAKDGTNLANTPRFGGELRYSGFPMLAEGVIDRYYPTPDGPILKRDHIVFPLTVNSITQIRNITEDNEYECRVDDNNQTIVLTRYVGTDSNVIVPETIVYQQKKVVDLSSTPTNLRIALYDSENKRVNLYNYEQETNTFTYILNEEVEVSNYRYKVFDINNNLLVENQLQEGDVTFSTLLPLANTYLTNPVVGPNTPTIDCGYITDNPVDFYDFGSVAKQIEGHWVSWYEWDRPKNWYPTNHVDISVEAPVDMDYSDFMTLFRDTFYEMASTVLYIHQLTQIYMFGNPNNDGTTEIQPMSLLTSSNYTMVEHCFTNDHEFLPYKKATDTRPLELKSYSFENPSYEYDEPNIHKYIVDFPAEWGTLSSITQTVIPYYNSWAYIWSLKFKDSENKITGILPVFLDRVSLVPTFDFRYYEDFTNTQQSNIPNYNSALWVDSECKLVNYIATNDTTSMVWNRDGSPVTITHEAAKLINWDDGHYVKNIPSVIINRFDFIIDDKIIGVSDTYGELASTDLNVSIDIKKKYEYVTKISDDDETFEWTDVAKAKLPCIQCNYTDWVGSTRDTELTEGDVVVTEYNSLPFFTVTCTPIVITNTYQATTDWLYALVINYADKDVAYTISKDLQQINLVAQSTALNKVQANIGGKIEYVRPNSIYYENNRWTLGYASYDQRHNFFQWKSCTLDKNNAQNEIENFGLGMGEYNYNSMIQQSYANHWNCDRYGEVLVKTKAEIQNGKFLIYICTDEGQQGALQDYHILPGQFDLQRDFTVPPYSYERDNVIWSCDFKKYIISNDVSLDEDSKKNSTLILLPCNIVYEDKNANIKCVFENRFGEIDYQFEKLSSVLNEIKQESTETELSKKDLTYYDYKNSFQSLLETSTFTFNTYGTLIKEEGIIFHDIDFLVISYLWDKGKDLDTYTRILNATSSSLSNTALGFYAYHSSDPASIPSGKTDQTALCYYAGDVTAEAKPGEPAQSEQILLNCLLTREGEYAQYLPNIIEFELRCAWWNTPCGEDGHVYVKCTGYKGGTMYRNTDTRSFYNVGGEDKGTQINEIFNIDKLNSYSDRLNANPPANTNVKVVAKVYYNKITKQATIVTIPKENS